MVSPPSIRFQPSQSWKAEWLNEESKTTLLTTTLLEKRVQGQEDGNEANEHAWSNHGIKFVSTECEIAIWFINATARLTIVNRSLWNVNQRLMKINVPQFLITYVKLLTVQPVEGSKPPVQAQRFSLLFTFSLLPFYGKSAIGSFELLVMSPK